LDAGPMSGFDNAKVDAEFFPDGRWKSNFLLNLDMETPASSNPATHVLVSRTRAGSFESRVMAAQLKKIEPSRSALVLIDLQRGITGRPSAPRSAAEVIRAAAKLASAFRERGGLVVLVHVTFSPDGADAPPRDVDEPMAQQKLPAGWDQICR